MIAPEPNSFAKTFSRTITGSFCFTKNCKHRSSKSHITNHRQIQIINPNKSHSLRIMSPLEFQKKGVGQKLNRMSHNPNQYIRNQIFYSTQYSALAHLTQTHLETNHITTQNNMHTTEGSNFLPSYPF